MRRTVLAPALLLAAAGGLLPAVTSAQSLRGSRASVQRMYDGAVEARLAFYKTSKGARAAAGRGDFVKLRSGRDYELVRVSFPYVVETTARWLDEFAPRYRKACGERLVVTSALRPSTRQPRNSVELSVHPTGMAIDLRKPRGRCLRWLRNELLDEEASGVIEATEERHPAHFHVAVFPEAIRERDGDRRARTVFRATTATVAPARDAEIRTATYEIRKGDTLWDLARRHGTTVSEIRSLNNLWSSTIKPGQQIKVPVGG